MRLRQFAILALILFVGLAIGVPKLLKATATNHTLPAQSQSVNWKLEVLKIGTVKSPVDIVDIKAAGQTISFGESKTAAITASEDFLKDAEINVINSSEKTINTISVQLSYYNPNQKSRVAYVDCWLGSWAHAPGIKPTVWVKPHEIVDIPIPKERYELFLNRIKASNSFEGTIKIRVVDVVFDGQPDIMWRNGQWMQRDPNDPLHFRRIRSESTGIQKISYKPRPAQVCLVDGGFYFRNCNSPFVQQLSKALVERIRNKSTGFKVPAVQPSTAFEAEIKAALEINFSKV